MRCNQLGLTIYSCLATRVTNALRKWCEWQVWTWQFFHTWDKDIWNCSIGRSCLLNSRMSAKQLYIFIRRRTTPSLGNCHSWIFLVDCVRHVWTHTQITRLFFSIHWKFLNTCKKWDIQVQDRVPHRENRFKAWNNRFYLRKLNLLSYHHHQIILNLTTFFLRWVVVSFTDHTSTKWGPL